MVRQHRRIALSDGLMVCLRNQYARQFYAKDRTFARTAFYFDRTAVLRDDPLCDGETEASPALYPAPRFVDAVEAFENPALFFLRDADSRVLDRNHGNIASIF